MTASSIALRRLASEPDPTVKTSWPFWPRALGSCAFSTAAPCRDGELGSGNPSGIDTGYLADILGRTVFGLLRSIMIRGWQLRTAGTRAAPSTTTLINQAFATVRIPPGRASPGHGPG